MKSSKLSKDRKELFSTFETLKRQLQLQLEPKAQSNLSLNLFQRLQSLKAGILHQYCRRRS